VGRDGKIGKKRRRKEDEGHGEWRKRERKDGRRMNEGQRGGGRKVRHGGRIYEG
jgi:hypothetical protein